MATITIRETVHVPVDTVFDFVDDYRNTTKYMQGLSKWQPRGSTTHGKGAQFEVAMKAGPTTLGSVVDIVSWSKNKVIGWHSIEGFKQKGEWSFKPKGEHTEVTFRLEYELPGGIAGRMLSRAADPVVRANLQKSARVLKEKAEQFSAAHPKAAAETRPTAKSTSTSSKSAAKAKPAAGAKTTAKSSAKSSAKRSTKTSTR